MGLAEANATPLNSIVPFFASALYIIRLYLDTSAAVIPYISDRKMLGSPLK